MRLSLLILFSCILLATAYTPSRRSKLSQRGAVSDSLGAGLFSLTQPDLSNPKNSLNAVVEQYIGILPPVALTAVQKALHPVLVLPLKDDLLVEAANNALLSITAAASGNAVTALAQLQECLNKQLKSKQGDVTCYTARGSPLSTISTIFSNLIEQSIGYLTPNVVKSLINNSGYYMSMYGSKIDGLPEAWKHISNAFESISASTAGNGATGLLKLTDCLLAVVQAEGKVPDTYRCAIEGPVSNLQIAVTGVIQQAAGYLPPNLILDLQRTKLPLSLSDTQGYNKALQTTFETSGAGPKFVSCFVELQKCVNAVLRTSQTTECTALKHACKVI